MAIGSMIAGGVRTAGALFFRNATGHFFRGRVNRRSINKERAVAFAGPCIIENICSLLRLKL
jgi:hypothetical protein